METFPRHSPVRRPISLPRERTLFFPPPSCPDPVLDLLVLATLSTLVSLSTLSLSDSEERPCVSDASTATNPRGLTDSRESKGHTKSNYVDLRLIHRNGGFLPRVLSPRSREKFRSTANERWFPKIAISGIPRQYLQVQVSSLGRWFRSKFTFHFTPRCERRNNVRFHEEGGLFFVVSTFLENWNLNWLELKFVNYGM